jgi:hypothetical protein
MKGYLQRLAASAARPQGAVHPFVSTLFSGTRRDGILEETTAEIHTPALREDAKGSAEIAAPIPSREEGVREGLRVEPLEPMLPGRRTRPVDQQEAILRVESVREHPAVDEPQPVALLLPQQPVETANPAGRSMAQPLVARVEEEAQELDAARMLPEMLYAPQPLLVEDRTPAQRDEQAARESPHREELQRPDRAAWPALRERSVGEGTGTDRRREVQHAGEDIQIHIGRIEVIAVQPAGARATVPARKSQTLDEYLKRRDGRAR